MPLWMLLNDLFYETENHTFWNKVSQGDCLISMGSNFFLLNHGCILLDLIVPVSAETEIIFFLVGGTVAVGVFWI